MLISHDNLEYSKMGVWIMKTYNNHHFDVKIEIFLIIAILIYKAVIITIEFLLESLKLIKISNHFIDLFIMKTNNIK
jgi:hypothetical protein